MKVKYNYSKNYQMVVANGVHGGRMGDDFVLNFFFDSEPLPESVEYVRNGKVKYSKLPHNINRDVFVGVVMNTNSLAALRDWIDNQLKQNKNKSE